MRKLFQRIPPTGNPVTVEKSDALPGLSSARTYLVQSGTAALAAALHIAGQHAGSNNSTAEVIIPAYCCPDLLAAVLYNNMKPVLVDLTPQTPYMDLELLKAALNENTVAVIAANFLGIPERLNEIRHTLASSRVLLIEDSAQWFPENDAAYSQHSGDLVIYSFGKGKPVCLMGGGALCIKNPALQEITPSISSGSTNPNYKHIIKFLAYNTVISKNFYWLLELMPFMDLGVTEYHALDLVQEMDKNAQGFLKANIECYQQKDPKQQRAWQASLAKLQKGNWDLTKHSNTYTNQRLLRYPILLPTKKAKNNLIYSSNRLGLGVSALYPKSLPNIKGIPKGQLFVQSYPAADDFANRIATLPTHAGVSEPHLTSTIKLLETLH